ncbi:MAG: glycosyltransferase [Deltaproteobacteria bacterium]|nr:glycosyltransferase [Deltaproteobacteria bacterium]
MGNTTPLVSIVMASLNQGKFIKEAIDSVLSQDYHNIELIVTDGLSTDNTIDILRSYGDRIRWISEKDKNLTDAINKGIKMSKGNFIHLLATDEVLCEKAISTLVNYMNSTGADIVVGQGFAIDSDSRVTYNIDNYLPINFEDVFTLKKTMPFAFSFFRRSVFDDHGLFDEEFRTCTDFMFWLTVFEKVKIVFVPERIGKFRYHEASWTGNPALSRKIFEAKSMALDKFFHRDPSYRHLQGIARVGAYAGLFMAHCNCGRYGKAIETIIRSFIGHPIATLKWNEGKMLHYIHHSIITMIKKTFRIERKIFR